MLAGAARVAGQDHLHGHVLRRAQHTEQPIDRVGRLVERGLLHPDVGDVAALVLVRVLYALEISEADAATVRHAPAQLAVVEDAAERPIDFTAALDRVLGADRGLAEHDGVERRAVALLLECPLAQHAVGLAAATRPAEENLFRRALDERVLWARLRRPGPMIWLAHASPGLHELLLPLLGAHRLVA